MSGMSVTEAFFTVATVVLLGLGIRIGFDFSRQRRLKRMAAETAGTFLGVELSAQARIEKERTAVGMPHIPVEADGASTDKHTGAGEAPGDAKLGPGVTVPMPDPTRCAHCHHYHLHVGSLLCEACEEEIGKSNPEKAE